MNWAELNLIQVLWKSTDRDDLTVFRNFRNFVIQFEFVYYADNWAIHSKLYVYFFYFALCINWQVPDPARFLLKNVSKFACKPLMCLYHYVNKAYVVLQTVCFNLYYLCFHYYLLSRIFSFLPWLQSECSPNSVVGYFCKYCFVFHKPWNKNVIHQPRSESFFASALDWLPREGKGGGTTVYDNYHNN